VNTFDSVCRVPAGAFVILVTVGDGPLQEERDAEVHEQLGGYYIVDCRDLDEALELAALCPMAEEGSIEVRPLAEVPRLHPHLDALRVAIAEG